VTRAVSGRAGRLVGDGGRVEVGVVSQPGADAEQYRCAFTLHVVTTSASGRGDGYQCGLDWELSSTDNHHCSDNVCLREGGQIHLENGHKTTAMH